MYFITTPNSLYQNPSHQDFSFSGQVFLMVQRLRQVSQGHKMYYSWSGGHRFERWSWSNLGCIVLLFKSALNRNTLRSSQIHPLSLSNECFAWRWSFDSIRLIKRWSWSNLGCIVLLSKSALNRNTLRSSQIHPLSLSNECFAWRWSFDSIRLIKIISHSTKYPQLLGDQRQFGMGCLSNTSAHALQKRVKTAKKLLLLFSVQWAVCMTLTIWRRPTNHSLVMMCLPGQKTRSVHRSTVWMRSALQIRSTTGLTKKTWKLHVCENGLRVCIIVYVIAAVTSHYYISLL